LNWRCPRNPSAGGAELVTHEIAKRLVAAGNSVEWFSALFQGAPTEELIDGIRIVRAGHQWSVHWCAFRRYRKSIRHNFDVVIDQVNTIPFMTPVWAGVPYMMFIHQLAREVWWYEARFPINLIGYLAEPLYLQVYRHAPVLTVSASTRADLLRLGFKGAISVIPEGLEPISPIARGRVADHTFLYVGRLAPSKRIADMIEALACFRKATGLGKLQLVGTGAASYLDSLMHLTRRLGVEAHVEVLGRIPAREKHLLMTRAEALLMTSIREGWGLAVTEANAVGTPAIGYDVPGLRDSIRDGVTGLIVPPNPQSLCDAMLRIAGDPSLRERLGVEAERWGRTFSFDVSARLVQDALGAACR
jgi:glycosyltransferase involved in cell wall biosynthesis